MDVEKFFYHDDQPEGGGSGSHRKPDHAPGADYGNSITVIAGIEGTRLVISTPAGSDRPGGQRDMAIPAARSD